MSQLKRPTDGNDVIYKFKSEIGDLKTKYRLLEIHDKELRVELENLEHKLFQKESLIINQGEKIYNLKTIRNFLIGISLALLTALIIELVLNRR